MNAGWCRDRCFVKCGRFLWLRLHTSRHQEHLAGHGIVQAERKSEKEKKGPYEQSVCVSVCLLECMSVDACS